MPLEIFFPVLVALFGAVLGSFGNVLIYRVPLGKSVGGRSGCPHCGRTLQWFELFPVLSYVALRGRCRTCHAGIALQYPLVELLSAGLALIAFFLAPDLVSALPLGLALWLLLLLAIIDGRTGMVPDALSIPFILVAVGWAFLRAPFTEELALDVIFAVAVATGFFFAQWLISRGRWVGSGDIFLAAGIGALVGTPVLAGIAIGLSYIIGALVAMVLILGHKKTLASQLAFGPFLAAGGFVTVMWSEDLLRILRLL